MGPADTTVTAITAIQIALITVWRWQEVGGERSLRTLVI